MGAGTQAPFCRLLQIDHYLRSWRPAPQALPPAGAHEPLGGPTAGAAGPVQQRATGAPTEARAVLLCTLLAGQSDARVLPDAPEGLDS